MVDSGQEPPFVVTADTQTHGRGRRGRTWTSDLGGVWMTLVVHASGSTSQVPLLTGLAVAETIEAETEKSALIKWPNDVLVRGAKVAGILCEREHKGDVAGPLVIGVGVNVNNPPPAGELVIPATSVADLAERPVDLETFTTGLVERVVQTIDSYAADPSDAWLDAINDRLAYRDQVVTLSAEGRADEVGSVRRVAPDGSLVVEVDGAERAVMSGAVSLRACATENGVVR